MKAEAISSRTVRDEYGHIAKGRAMSTDDKNGVKIKSLHDHQRNMAAVEAISPRKRSKKCRIPCILRSRNHDKHQYEGYDFP